MPFDNHLFSLAKSKLATKPRVEMTNEIKISNTASSASDVREGKMLDRRSVMIGLGLAAGATLSYFGVSRVSAAAVSEEQFQRMIPEMVEGWKSRKSSELVLPAQDDMQAKLYENLETRVYEGPDLPSIMMLIAYSRAQQNNVQVHRPEVCYPASGYPITANEPTLVDFGGHRISARELVADRDGVNERIVYWVRVGEQFPVGWAEQRFAMAKANALGNVPDGLLFRASVVEEDPNYTAQALQSFIKSFGNSIAGELQNRVFFGRS